MTDRLIEPDPGGRPVIAGTHITVAEVLKELAEWGEVDRLLMAHPELDRESVRAALEFAAWSLPPAPVAESPAASEPFTPRTEFGKTMWSLHRAAVEEARERGEPLLETWEDVRREARERRGERDDAGAER